jgi:hypothetical protein
MPARDVMAAPTFPPLRGSTGILMPPRPLDFPR